jgi:hypothetical protein
MRKALRSSRYTGRTPGGVPKLAPVGRKRSRPRSAPRRERSGTRATTVAASRTTVAASTIRHVSAAAPLPYYKVVLALRSLAWPDVVPD